MAALRAGYLAFILSVLGTAIVATAVLSGPPVPGTIAEAIGAPTGPELDERRALAVAQRTQGCMAALGFAFDAVPEPPPAIPDAHLAPVAWAERWGFGIATSVGLAVRPAPPDPNAQRMASLPEPARATYVAALYGDGQDDPGCHGAALEAVYGLRDRALAPLRSRLDALQRAIDADPGVPAVERAWDGCVRGLGIARTERATLVERMRRSFSERTAAVLGDERLVAAVAAEERGIAAGIARCEVAFGAGMAAVAAPYEARFVATYHALLERIGARIRAAEAAYPVSPPARSGRPRADAAR